MEKKEICDESVPRKSRSDHRDYRVLNLQNGVKILLASDMKPPWVKCSVEAEEVEEEEMEEEEGEVEEGVGFEILEDEVRLSAAAVCVGVGSFHEPKGTSYAVSFRKNYIHSNTRCELKG